MEQFLQDDWIKTLTSEEMTSSFSEYQSDMVLKNIREYNVHLFIFREEVTLFATLKISSSPGNSPNLRGKKWHKYSKYWTLIQVE